MMNELPKTSAIEALRARLKAAKARLSTAKATAKAATQKEHRAEAIVNGIQHAIDMELITQWGDAPDIAQMLHKDASSVFFAYLTDWLEQRGMWSLGIAYATGERHVSFSIRNGDVDQCNLLSRWIPVFSGYAKKYPGGTINFTIFHTDMEHCDWSLHYHPRRGTAKVVQSKFCNETESIPFNTLPDALWYIAQHLSSDDAIGGQAREVLEIATNVLGQMTKEKARKAGRNNHGAKPTSKYECRHLGGSSDGRARPKRTVSDGVHGLDNKTSLRQ